MNECLVTKLRCSVSDADLRKIGEFRFSKANDGNSFVGLSAEEPLTISILNDGYFCKADSTEKDESKGKTITYNVGESAFYALPSSIISVVEKYKISSLTLYSALIDLSELSYMENIKRILLTGTSVSGNVEHLNKLVNLLTMDISDTGGNVFGNLERLHLESLTKIKISGTKITGDIAKCFKNSVNLSEMQIANSEMTGSIEGLVSALVASGKTSGEIKIPYAKVCKNITYKGESLSTSAEVPPSAGSNKITWSGTSISWS